MDRYCRERIRVSGTLWHGRVLKGVSGIVDLCRSIDVPEAVLCKDRPKITAACIGGCFVKRYNLPGFLTRLRRCFKRSRPSYALDGAVALESLNIATPQVRAALIESRGLSLRREYLVTDELDKSVRLFSVICTPQAPESWEILLEKVIPVLCRMHDAGWLHGDLSLRNIYLADGAQEAGFIDLDGMRRCGDSLPDRCRAAEIARLVSSFMHYTRDTSAAAKLTAEAVERYNLAGKTVITPEKVTAAMHNMLFRVEKMLTNKRRNVNDE